MAFRDVSVTSRLESFNLAVSRTQLWPLYNRLLRYDAVAHRLALVCKLPLVHYGWTSAPRPPSAPAPGSQTISARFFLTFGDVAASGELDFETSRFLEPSGPLYLVHGLTLATVAWRLPLVCKLPLIPIARLTPPLSGESVPPGCHPPTPGSHIGLPRVDRIFRRISPLPRSVAFQSCDSSAQI